MLLSGNCANPPTGQDTEGRRVLPWCPARRPDRAAYRPVAVTQTETTAHTVRTAEVPEDGSKAVPTVRVQDQSQANAAPLR